MGFLTRNINRLTSVSSIAKPGIIGSEILHKSIDNRSSLTNLIMRTMSTLNQMHRKGPHHKKRPQRKVGTYFYYASAFYYKICFPAALGRKTLR